MNRCRICKGELSKELLVLKNVPAAAQKMPSTREECLADKGVDLAICQCLNCGVLQHTSPPVPYYREVIRASGVSETMRQFRLEQFSSWVKRYDLIGKKVFEAGCGRGEYLALMNASGVTACGTEFSDSGIIACRQQDLQVFKTFFDTGEETMPQAPYDGFFILNFLEHIPDIPAFLTGIRKNLKENAPGIIEVPNLDMILANAQLTEYSCEHIYYFTAANLTAMLQNHGFDVISCRSVWHDYIISAEVIKRKAVDLSSCHAVRQELTAQIHHFAAQCGKCAFWGAGHQALTTLALTGMDRKKICFVADSSPEKQNRFTFTTHIPIVAPEALADDDIDGVIVACGGYSDEVAGLITQRFSQIRHLAILRANKLEIIK